MLVLRRPDVHLGRLLGGRGLTGRLTGSVMSPNPDLASTFTVTSFGTTTTTRPAPTPTPVLRVSPRGTVIPVRSSLATPVPSW